jgi:hypothetical protein
MAIELTTVLNFDNEESLSDIHYPNTSLGFESDS